MKKTKICAWGGASLLILALVASISLAVTPQNLTNEYGDDARVVNATDDTGYAVLNVYGDTAGSTIQDFVSNNVLAKIVLQADWGAGRSFRLANDNDGSSLIIDLQGHTFSGEYNEFYLQNFQVMDSSAAETGVIDVKYIQLHNFPNKCFTLYGGTITGNIYLTSENESGGDSLQCYLYGGNITGGRGVVFKMASTATTSSFYMYGGTTQVTTERIGNLDFTNYKIQMQIAPWVGFIYDPKVDENDNAYVSWLTASTPYDYFAVSSTPLVAGAYNYAYALGWEMSTAEFSKLAIPTDKTYYLWARNDGDAWYRYLNLRYVDGAWQAA